MRPRTLFRVALLLNAVITVLVTLVAYGFVRRADDTDQRVIQSHRTIAVAQEVLRRVVDAETGARGYQLSHDDQDLVPFRRAVKITPRLIETLAVLMNANPQQAASTQQLRAEVLAVLDTLGKIVALSPRDAAIGVSLQTAQRAQMVAVRNRIRAILPKENALLNERNEEDLAADRTVNWMMLAMTSLAVAVTSAGTMLALFFFRPGFWSPPRARQ